MRPEPEEDIALTTLVSLVGIGRQNVVESGRTAGTARISRSPVSTQMANETESRSEETHAPCKVCGY